MREQSKERQTQKSIEKREQAFNVYLSGANQQRVQNQILEEKYGLRTRDGSKGRAAAPQGGNRSNSKGARRQWKLPTDEEPSLGTIEEKKYTNPFETSGKVGPSTTPGNQGSNPFSNKPVGVPPSAPSRKKWGQKADNDKQKDQVPDQFGGKLIIKNDKFILESDSSLNESDYSDEKFEDQTFQQEQSEIKDLLLTATEEQLNVLKQSLSNFTDPKNNISVVSPGFARNQATIEDEYIEEDFEEDIEDTAIDQEEIPEVADESDDKEDELLRIRRELQAKTNRLQSVKTVQGNSRSNRPISATYNLSALQSQSNLNKYGAAQTFTKPASNPEEVLSALRAENARVAQTNRHDGNQFSFTELPAETPKNPSELKKPVTNPFKARPVSHMIPKRSGENPLMTLKQKQEAEKMKEATATIKTMKEIKEETTNKKAVSSQGYPYNQALQETSFSRGDQFLEQSAAPTTELTASNTGMGASQQSGETNQIAVLLNQIQQLEDSQRHQLFNMLKDLDNKGSLSTPNLNEGLIRILSPKIPSPSKQDSKSKTLAAPKKVELQQPQKERINNDLRLKVLSTLGNPHVCGLTEIELFDNQGVKLNLSPSCLMVRNQGKGPKVPVSKLINGHKLTSEATHMWLGYLPPPSSSLEIQIYFNKGIELGGLKIWNYNKGIVDCTKGVQQMQVILNDMVKWEGVLPPGKGQINTDYSKRIVLIEGCQIPTEQPLPTPQSVVSKASTIKEEPAQKDTAFFSKRRDVSPIKKLQDEQFEKYKNQQQAKQSVQALEKKKVPEVKAEPMWFDDLNKKEEKKLPQAAQQQQTRPSVHQGAREKEPQMTATKPVKDDKNTIASAVNQAILSVEKAVERDKSRSKPKRRQIKIEESLDSLDYFKVTSLGRLQNEMSSQQAQRKQDEPIVKQKASERAKWQAEPNVRQQMAPSSVSSSKDSAYKKHGAGPKVISSPFPEDVFSYPSPAGSRKSLKSNKSTKQMDMQDALDEFLGKAPHGKQSEIPTMVAAKQQVVPEPAIKTDLPQPKKQRPQSVFQPRAKQLDSIMPTLPFGSQISINITKTWGDMNYLGLTGIEIFDFDGKQIKIEENLISACPPDINVMPGYGEDPRTIEKLVDGNYFTNDDLHVWLTPFTPGEDHTITIDFGQKTYVSMVRVWNYNKSRIHSYRGARDLQMSLDDKLIFSGEIKKAPGNTKDPEQCCEIILFTENDTIIDKIDQHDWLNGHEIMTGFEDTQRLQNIEGGLEERPMTATKKFSTQEIDELQFQLAQQSKPTSLFDERPQTSAIIQSERIGDPVKKKQPDTEFNLEAITEVKSPEESRLPSKKPAKGIRARTILINITESWGDLFYVGLNGLEVLNASGQPVPIQVTPDDMSRTSVTAKPRDMNAIPGHGSDHRKLENLFNGKNNTIDDRNMWLIPYNNGEDHIITIDLGETRSISGLRFYNYNKSVEDSLRGTRQLTITVDGVLMTPRKGITIAKAPGFLTADLNLANDISIPLPKGWTTEEIIPIQRNRNTLGQLSYYQEYDPIAMPTGFCFKFNLYSTHGDLYYIGLNGIQMYDQLGRELLKPQSDVKYTALPKGVNELPGMEKDIRTVDKLLNGKNETLDDSNMWLAPFKNTKGQASAKDTHKREPNFVCFFFDRPQAVSIIRVWNYSKTPARGVNEIELEVDGKQVFRSYVKKAPAFTKTGQDNSSAILFYDNSSFAQKMGQQIFFDPSKRQNVSLMNERKLMNSNQEQKIKEKFVFNETDRPTTTAVKL